MTKSQNTKDEQQKDLCITSEQLTEQWKKDELPDGHYYVRDGENIIAELLDGYFYNNGEPMTSFSGGVDEVLAPVPSFDELQNMNKAVNECMAANIKLVEQNTKLKELLKECVEYVKKDYSDYLTYTQSAIYQEISEVLGEE